MISLLVLASAALADVPPADTSGCNDKAAGDSCSTDGGERGACVTDTCSRLDYSNGTPPTSVDYECLRCDASAKSSGGCGDSGATAAGLLVGAFALLRLRRPTS